VLGVRPPRVTQLAGRLQKQGVIELQKRATSRCLDRESAEDLSCDATPLVKKETDRLPEYFLLFSARPSDLRTNANLRTKVIIAIRNPFQKKKIVEEERSTEIMLRLLASIVFTAPNLAWEARTLIEAIDSERTTRWSSWTGQMPRDGRPPRSDRAICKRWERQERPEDHLPSRLRLHGSPSASKPA